MIDFIDWKSNIFGKEILISTILVVNSIWASIVGSAVYLDSEISRQHFPANLHCKCKFQVLETWCFFFRAFYFSFSFVPTICFEKSFFPAKPDRWAETIFLRVAGLACVQTCEWVLSVGHGPLLDIDQVLFFTNHRLAQARTSCRTFGTSSEVGIPLWRERMRTFCTKMSFACLMSAA